MTAPRYIVRLRDGTKLEAVDVEWQTGRVRVTVVQTRWEYDNARNEAWRVPVGLRHRVFPVSRIDDVEDLDEPGRSS